MPVSTVDSMPGLTCGDQSRNAKIQQTGVCQFDTSIPYTVIGSYICKLAFIYVAATLNLGKRQ